MTRDNTTPNLKPCHECGGEAMPSEMTDGCPWMPQRIWKIWCWKCKRITNGHHLFSDAADQWNTRAEVPQPVTDAERQQAWEMIDRYMGYLKECVDEYAKKNPYTGFVTAVNANRRNLVHFLDRLRALSAQAPQQVDLSNAVVLTQGQYHALLDAVKKPNPVDVESLKRPVSGWETAVNHYNQGYNAAIDHISSEYALIKKVKNDS